LRLAATAAAWLVTIVLAGVFGAADASAARHHAPTHECATAGAMIPDHDSSIPGRDEIAARAEAYSGM
jgi:hypothetical protein